MKSLSTACASLLVAALAGCASSSPRAPKAAASEAHAYPAKTDAQSAVAVPAATALSPSRSAYLDRAERLILDYERRIAALRLTRNAEPAHESERQRLRACLAEAQTELSELRAAPEGGAAWSARRNRLDVTLEDLHRGWEQARAE